eukprot:7353972-Heterocapsa_arctica.AAC.1
MPSFHSNNIVGYLSDCVFRDPNGMLSFSSRRTTFCGAYSAVSSAWKDVRACSSKPTTFPGTWQPLDVPPCGRSSESGCWTDRPPPKVS